jgi:hypothetical protein
MKRFVIFGDIEFPTSHEALVHNIKSAEYIEDADIEARASELDNCDFLVPHYYDGVVTFVKYQEEK